MKLNGDSSQYTPIPIQGEDSSNCNKQKNDTKDMIENDFHMAPLATPEESKDEVNEKVVPMTPLRKFCFVLSILQCVLFIIAFGWLIPCKLPRYINQPSSVLNWSAVFPSSELLKLLEVSPYDTSEVVVLGFSSLSNESSSIQALNIKDGSIRWHLSLPGEPFSLDCSHLDVDSDGISECLIGLTDHSGHMAALNKSNRHIFWFLHSHQNAINVVSIGKPVVGVDCDDDKVKEVIFPFVDSSGSFFMGTASGLTGQISGTVSLMSICKKMPESLTTWNVTDSQNIAFVCSDGSSNILHSLPSVNFCENTTNLDFGKLDSQTLERFDGTEAVNIRTFSSHGGTNNLLALTHGGRVVVLKEYRKILDTDVSKDGYFPALLSLMAVHLSNDSNTEIVIASTDKLNGSNIVVFNLTSGGQVHQLHFGNVTILQVFEIQQPSKNTEGVILRVLEVLNGTNDVQSSNDNGTRIYSEKFILVECFKTGVYKTILSTNLYSFCNENVCRPDVFSPQKSASVTDVDGDGKAELVFFHRTLNISEGVEQTEVRLERLDSVLSADSCSSCGCHS